jgi:hypothetical protein
LVGCNLLPTKEDPKVTLAFRASLTREVAEAFGCRDIIYAGDCPRSGVEKISLEGEEIDCGIHFKHDSFAFHAVANSLGHYVAKMEGTGPTLLFSVKLTGYAEVAAQFVCAVHIDPLDITLKPTQQPLDLQEEAQPAEAEDSERLISKEQAADTAAEDATDFMAEVGIPEAVE